MTDTVRLEYVGENRGSIPFTVNGRRYKGGNNPLHKFVDAHPQDVESLLLLGRWRLAKGIPDAPAPAKVISSPPPVRKDPTVGKTGPQTPPKATMVTPRSAGEAALMKGREELDGLEAPENDFELIPELGGKPKVLSPLPGTVDEIKTMIPMADKSTLVAWVKEERAGKSRKTALEALQGALDALDESS